MQTMAIQQTQKQRNKIYQDKLAAVSRKVWQLKEPRANRKALLEDLLTCNNEDVLDVLVIADITTEKDYIDTINAFISLELVYLNTPKEIKLLYKVGTFKAITDFLRLRHRAKDLLNNIGV